ncbi:adenosylcobinamide amidohydrolase [Aliiroseovarius subalbicans]|uniref:adenosylcobinamide amidohydrolase n=1 Tax=Aliiroseovarius subalbicans TaxID=2925840 RepID=UPI001F55E801|nr:adenosylcobinamide amidohydrolase [Aliiroseovarius subalbicans]MCI2399229.1 adenosylcobinamide amidohydrolase [Aliiroseovarius subalbicans]
MLTLTAPWLEMDLGAEMQVLSWALNRPGFVTARHLLWREVRNADLTPDLDVAVWLRDALAACDRQNAVAMLTSRDVSAHHEGQARVGDVRVDVTATVGLSNAERVGHRVDYSRRDWGTINIGIRVSEGLTQAALLEAMSIATQARTAAVMEAGFSLPTGIATGTGTDCIAVAAPEGDQPFAGLHTEVGEALGRAVYDVILDGTKHWIAHSFRGNHDLEGSPT